MKIFLSSNSVFIESRGTYPIDSIDIVESDGGFDRLSLVKKDRYEYIFVREHFSIVQDVNGDSFGSYDSTIAYLRSILFSGGNGGGGGGGNPISNHNSLSGLQGGGGGQFFHLTSSELTKLQNLPTSFVNPQQVAINNVSSFNYIHGLGRLPQGVIVIDSFGFKGEPQDVQISTTQILLLFSSNFTGTLLFY